MSVIQSKEVDPEKDANREIMKAKERDQKRNTLIANAFSENDIRVLRWKIFELFLHFQNSSP
jgi:hypothetical protein